MNTVNVLIYSEPIIFLEQVEKNSWLLQAFSNALISPLSEVKSREYKFWVICDEFQGVEDTFVKRV